MRNKNLGLPKGFEGNLVKHKFPEDKPIFWGPGQSTKYPEVYAEPEGWLPQDIMRIPPVIRFITGGTSAPAIIIRQIYLGFMTNSEVGQINFKATDFTQRADIVALYNSNQSTIQVCEYTGPYSFGGPIGRRWYFHLFNNINGTGPGIQTNTLFWYTTFVDVDATGNIPSFGLIFADQFIGNLTADYGLLLQP